MATVSNISMKLAGGRTLGSAASAEITPPNGQLVSDCAVWAPGVDPTQFLQDLVAVSGTAAGRPYHGQFRLAGLSGSAHRRVRLDP